MADETTVLSARVAEQAATLAELLAAGGAAGRAQVEEAFSALATTLERLGDALRATGGDGSQPLPPLEVTVPVLGVDACEAGWVGAILEPGAPRPRIAVAATIADLVETVRQSLDIQAVAIALPEETPSHAASGRSTVPEIDVWVRSRPTVLVLGAHPDVSFTAMTGAPIVAGKETDEGRVARLAALRAAGLASPSVLHGSGYAAHDVLDACAAAWTAARRMNGEAHPAPDPSRTSPDGIPAAIWV